MKLKRFINSKYYSLKEVKELNDYILSLQQQVSLQAMLFDSVLKAANTYCPYRNLSDYVRGSEIYNKILEEKENYKNSQEYLKSLNHKRVEVINEVYPDYLLIYKHTITVEKSRHNYDFDYDSDESETYVGEDVFFSYEDKVISDFNCFVLPYVCKEYYEPKDLINEAIVEINSLTKKILAYQMSERLGVKLFELEMVFRINDLDHFHNMSSSFIKYKEKDYYDNGKSVV